MKISSKSLIFDRAQKPLLGANQSHLLRRCDFYSNNGKLSINYYMPSSNTFQAVGVLYSKADRKEIKRDTLILQALEHPKSKLSCEGVIVVGAKVEDRVQWRFCANKAQFSKVGQTIPDFSFEDIDKNKYTLDSFKNKVVFINTWFIGCVPCVGEFPLLKKLSTHYLDNENVVFLSFARTSEKKLLSNEKMYEEPLKNFILVPNDNVKLENYFGMTGYPTNYILDKEGYLRFMTNGYPLKPGMEWKDYKKGFIHEEIYQNYIYEIDKLLNE